MRWAVAAALGILAPAGCGGDSTGTPDARDGADAAPLGPWSAPTPITLAPADPGDQDPALTGDLLELYFASTRNAGSGNDLFVTRRAAIDQPWDPPAPVTVLNSPQHELQPAISPDGLVIYFGSSRVGTLGGFDIYRATRASRAEAFGAVLRVNVSETPSELPGCIDPTGTTLMFGQGLSATSYDLYVATDLEAASPTVTALAVDPAPATNIVPGCISPAGDTVYFAGNGPAGDLELYVAQRAPDGTFAAARTIDELVSAEHDDDLWVAADGRRAVFRSVRSGQSLLYEATR